MIRAEHSVEIDRPIEDVFAFVADQSNEPKWHTDVVEVVRPGPDQPIQLGSSVVWVIDFMGRSEYEAEVTVFEPNRCIELTARRGPLKPILTHRFERAGSGTRYTRHIDIPPSGVFRVLEPILRAAGVARKRQIRFAENLKTVLEQ
ncbi:MAG: SRPBCC family protein [Candidatus Limnocylindria bacterium]